MAFESTKQTPEYVARPHPQESRRIESLHSLDLLDSPPDLRFDRLTSLAADVFDVPTCVVSLVDINRQWFLSRCKAEVRILKNYFSWGLDN